MDYCAVALSNYSHISLLLYSISVNCQNENINLDNYCMELL
jgi:hypothetical protein